MQAYRFPCVPLRCYPSLRRETPQIVQLVVGQVDEQVVRRFQRFPPGRDLVPPIYAASGTVQRIV